MNQRHRLCRSCFCLFVVCGGIHKSLFFVLVNFQAQIQERQRMQKIKGAEIRGFHSYQIFLRLPNQKGRVERVCSMHREMRKG